MIYYNWLHNKVTFTAFDNHRLFLSSQQHYSSITDLYFYLSFYSFICWPLSVSIFWCQIRSLRNLFCRFVLFSVLFMFWISLAYHVAFFTRYNISSKFNDFQNSTIIQNKNSFDNTSMLLLSIYKSPNKSNLLQEFLVYTNTIIPPTLEHSIFNHPWILKLIIEN